MPLVRPWFRPTARWMDAAARRRREATDRALRTAFAADERFAIQLLDVTALAGDRDEALAAADRLLGWMFDTYGTCWIGDLRLRGREAGAVRLVVRPGRDDHVHVGNPHVGLWAELPTDLIEAIRYVGPPERLPGVREPRRPYPPVDAAGARLTEPASSRSR